MVDAESAYQFLSELLSRTQRFKYLSPSSLQTDIAAVLCLLDFFKAFM